MAQRDEAFVSQACPTNMTTFPLPGTLVQSIVKNLEKQLETPVKKPSGGVSMFLRPNAALQRTSTPARKSQVGHLKMALHSMESQLQM